MNVFVSVDKNNTTQYVTLDCASRKCWRGTIIICLLHYISGHLPFFG